MRTPRNDQLGRTDRAGRRGDHAPERRCVVTGAVAPAEGLVRLALGPDGVIAPDVLGKAPGRGAWIGVPRAELETAQAKGKAPGRARAGAACEGFHDPRRSRCADRGAASPRGARPVGARSARGHADPRQRAYRGSGAARAGAPAAPRPRCRRGRAPQTGAGMARRHRRRRLGPAGYGLAGGPGRPIYGIGARQCGASGVDRRPRRGPGAGAFEPLAVFHRMV